MSRSDWEGLLICDSLFSSSRFRMRHRLSTPTFSLKANASHTPPLCWAPDCRSCSCSCPFTRSCRSACRPFTRAALRICSRVFVSDSSLTIGAVRSTKAVVPLRVTPTTTILMTIDRPIRSVVFMSAKWTVVVTGR